MTSASKTNLLLMAVIALALALLAYAMLDRPGDATAAVADGGTSISGLVVEIEGVTLNGQPMAAQGLESFVEVIEYQDGDDLILRKRPGRTKYDAPLVMTLPYSVVSTGLIAWWNQIIDGQINRRDIVVQFQGADGSTVAGYNVYEAWPCAMEVSPFEGAGGLRETWSFCYERMERQ